MLDTTSGPPSALAWLEFAFSVFFLRGFSMCFLGLNLGDGFRLIKQLLMCALIVVVIVGSGLLSWSNQYTFYFTRGPSWMSVPVLTLGCEYNSYTSKMDQHRTWMDIKWWKKCNISKPLFKKTLWQSFTSPKSLFIPPCSHGQPMGRWVSPAWRAAPPSSWMPRSPRSTPPTSPHTARPGIMGATTWAARRARGGLGSLMMPDCHFT